MNAKKFVVAVGLFAVLYTVLSVLVRIDGKRMLGDPEKTKLDRGYYISIPTNVDTKGILETQRSTHRCTSQVAENILDRKWKYNISLTPEYYALRRPLESSEFKPTPDLDRKSITRLEARATIASKQGEAGKRFPTTLIIGVRKAGTRALLAILNLHPQVKSCGPEVHFFDQRYPRGLAWYLNQTPEVLPEQRTIEKTPSYFVVKDVPERILSYSEAIGKDLKFLVIVRDPTVRAISDYVQINVGIKAKYNKQLAPFERMVMKNGSAGIVNTAWGVVKTGVYSKHLERWLRHFPLDWFHFVSGEQLVQNPYREIKKVERFLGLKPFFKENNFVFNPAKGFPCFRGSSEKSGLRCLGKAKGRAHPAVEPRIISELRKYYRPFNEQFYKMVNRDFQWP